MKKRSEMPKPVRIESGCRVGWYYYSTREDAETVSTWAREAGARAEAMGYDHGFCTVGEIKEIDGLFCVTVP